MQHWAAQRDEQKALAFFCELMTFHSFEDLLVLDEMARDRSAMRSLFGRGSRGSVPIERNVPHYRGQRISALCVFTLEKSARRPSRFVRFYVHKINTSTFGVRMPGCSTLYRIRASKST